MGSEKTTFAVIRWLGIKAFEELRAVVPRAITGYVTGVDQLFTWSRDGYEI